LDLIQISAKGPNGVPICRIVDFYKYAYNQEKKAAAKDSKNTVIKSKEV
jgi:translation initiation factor IF-3